MARPRRSSRLGADPRGDTGAPAFATAFMQKSSLSSSSIHLSKTKAGVSKTHSKRLKARSPWQQFSEYSTRQTWTLPLLFVLVIVFVYSINPTESNPFHAAIFLSYPLSKLDANGRRLYGKGRKDFAFVAFYTIFLLFTREFCMQRIIRPWALYCGIRSRRKLARFMEQMYVVMYFTVLIPWGLYVMSRSSIWYFNTTAMFEGFPHREHEGFFKAYYLVQASYWTQQAIVLLLQLEKPRTDHKEYVAHHMITIALIWLSYRFHFTYMGLAVYITHDISDFGLSSSRIFNYLDSIITGPYYATFVLVWIYTRHYQNLRILWAVLTEFASVGPYELNWETQQYKCWISQIITFVLLACLQALNLFWLFLILRIAWRYAVTRVPEDTTSDVEEEEDEVEVTVDGSHLKKASAKGIVT